MSTRKKIFLGLFILVLTALVYRPLIQELWKPTFVGDEILTKYSKKYSLIGKKVVDKEIGAIISTQMVPALFIYLLQDRDDPDKLLVVVSQSYGYSIGKITIGGSALSAPITVAGGGKFWGNYIHSYEGANDMFYETHAVVSNRKDGEISITVTYFWIWRGPGVNAHEFEDRSDTTNAIFQLSP